MFKTFLFFFFLLVAISCSQDIHRKAVTNFPVKSLSIPGDNGDDWGDADFAISITSISENDTSTIYKAVSTYKNEDLGLLISVPNAPNGDKGFGDGITLKSIGKQSDRLLSLLATLYKQKLPANSKFINSISLAYVDLNQFGKTLVENAPNNDTGVQEYKLFFQSKADEAELYLNIKPKEQLVEIKEKDGEYRPTIIKMLEAH